ncbi:MAG TPA: M23 family metallopeptidase [Pyrinomonadaceae bacterium]|nr:M23 family metallopeptidase [Pyrinomonadaceae bacterium]
MKRCFWFLLILILNYGPNVNSSPGQTTSQPQEYYDIPINIEAPVDPIPVKGADGKWYLVYHLFLTNLGFSDLTLKSVEVSDALRRNVLGRYGEKELADYYRFRTLLPTPPRSEMPNKEFPRQISSGRTGVLFFWLTVDSPAAIPASLKHRFVFEPNPLIKLRRGLASDQEGGEMVLEGYAVGVSKDKPVVISPPLRGGDWRCSNGPAYNSIHQLLTIRGGNVRIAQRFACDFNKVDKEGNILPNPFPDEITNKMFYGYGAEVLAVGDGNVVFVKDGIPENVPQASGAIKPSVPLTRETNAGNWIAIDLGGNRYALYAHLQPNSIRVKTGDRVRRGQVIALLGDSGNAVGPHLHFHIGDQYRLNGADLNGNEGLPFVFDSFVVGGQKHRMEMPINNTVMQFQ